MQLLTDTVISIMELPTAMAKTNRIQRGYGVNHKKKESGSCLELNNFVNILEFEEYIFH